MVHLVCLNCDSIYHILSCMAYKIQSDTDHQQQVTTPEVYVLNEALVQNDLQTYH